MRTPYRPLSKLCGKKEPNAAKHLHRQNLTWTGNYYWGQWKIIISLLRDLGKMSEENTHNECKFLGHERPLGLEWPKNLHEWWVFPTNFPKSQGREWYLFHNDVFPNSCEENEWGKQSLEWGKYCQNDTKLIFQENISKKNLLLLSSNFFGNYHKNIPFKIHWCKQCYLLLGSTLKMIGNSSENC